MNTYLRFTPREYQSIVRVCRPIDLTDDFFPIFKYFLVASLEGVAPELATRISHFRKHEVGIIYEYLRARQQTAAARRGQVKEQRAQASPDLTFEEWQAVSQASRSFALPDSFLHSFQHFLVQQFTRSAPGLARKLARLSDRQMERLYARLKARRGSA